MLDLIKNIGLGLFVNGSFALMNGNFDIASFVITFGSIALMWACIHLSKRRKNGA